MHRIWEWRGKQNPRDKASGEEARAHPQQTGAGSLAGPGREVGGLVMNIVRKGEGDQRGNDGPL